jgi:GLPGLI family protein
MKSFLSLILFVCLSYSLSAQKKISELTLVYDAKVTTGNAEPNMADAFDGATTTIYLKGNLSRSEMASALFSSTTIHDTKTGTAVVLREVSGQKLLIRMSSKDWKEKNARYEGITFTNTGETKEIAGYKCLKAVAKMSDGSSFTVYYTPDIIPENREYDYHFKNLNGLPLEYELTQRNLTIRYTVSKINLNPVQASKYDIPTSGYREMTYEESQKTKR